MRIAGTYMQFVEVIIVLNVLIFILSVTNPITNFTLVPAKVLERPWTILTSMFIHYNVWHLILNMFALFFLGSYLVGVIGEDKLIRIYFVGGIAGGLFFTCFAFLWGLLGISGLWGLLAHPHAGVIGASGAIFAVGGALAVLRPNQPVLLMGVIPMRLWVAIAVCFFVILPGIALEAHLGGLVAGILFGYYYKKKVGSEVVYSVTRYY